MSLATKNQSHGPVVKWSFSTNVWAELLQRKTEGNREACH
jgi:hypothetical protein